MRFTFIFKPMALALLFFFFVGCNDLQRNNPLDPKNPDSFSQTVPLIEAFVNLSHPSPYNGWAIQSLNALSAQFDEQIIVVEYHRDIEIDSVFYDDPYNEADQQAFFKQLHDRYVQLWPELSRLLPDVFVNGAQHRVPGAYDALSVKNSTETTISELLAQKNDYTLEIEVEQDGMAAHVTCLVARLGNKAAEHLRLRVLFVQQASYQNWSLQYVVKMSWPGIRIDKLKAGAYTTIDAGQIATSRASGVVCALVTENEQQVLQAKYAHF